MTLPAHNSVVPSRIVESHDERGICLNLRAHNALNARQARWFLVTVSIGPCLTAGFCLWRGFWPVLPFAGLELGLLYMALRWSMQRGRRREFIEISERDVLITAENGALETKTRFPRHWTRVRLRAPRLALHPSRLCFESGGRHCEVGSFLTEDERRALAVRLKQLVGNMNDSPRL